MKVFRPASRAAQGQIQGHKTGRGQTSFRLKTKVISGVRVSEVDPAASDIIDIPVLQLFPCPRVFPQKGEAGFNGGIKHEAADLDLIRQPFPTVGFHHSREHRFQSNPVQGIVGMGVSFGHGATLSAKMTEEQAEMPERALTEVLP